LVCIAIAGLEHRQKQIVTRKKVKNSPAHSFVWLPAKELCFFQQMEQVSSVISLELRGPFPSGICAYHGSLSFVIWFDNTACRVSVSNLLPGPKDQVSDEQPDR
jgi:hypothetical protein